MNRYINRKWVRGWRDTSGVAALEFAIIAPFLFSIFVGAVAVFDLYRHYNNMIGAANAVGRYVTVQDAITISDLQNKLEVFAAVAPSQYSAIRIASIQRQGAGYQVLWEMQIGSPAQVDVNVNYPELAEGETVLQIDTSINHKWLFNFLGFGSSTFSYRTWMRPRYVASLPLLN